MINLSSIKNILISYQIQDQLEGAAWAPVAARAGDAFADEEGDREGAAGNLLIISIN